jgi:hypothetical protein
MPERRSFEFLFFYLCSFEFCTTGMKFIIYPTSGGLSFYVDKALDRNKWVTYGDPLNRISHYNF